MINESFPCLGCNGEKKNYVECPYCGTPISKAFNGPFTPHAEVKTEITHTVERCRNILSARWLASKAQSPTKSS